MTIAYRAEPATTASALRVTEVQGLSEAAALGDEWRALTERDLGASVFQTPEWVLSWWQHLAGAESPSLAVVRAADGTLAGLAPLTRGRAPAPVRRLNILGRGGSLTEYVDIVALPEAAEAVTVALLRHWRQTGGWDLLAAPNVPADRPLGHLLARLAAAAGRRAVVERQERVWRPLPPSWEAFTASLGRNQRKHLKKFANRLSREGHTTRFVVETDPARLDVALDRFLELHRRRAEADLGVRHKDRFETPARRAFLRAAARRFFERGQLLPCFLEVDDRPVAAQLCFIHRETLYPYHSGFDPAWAWHGVMLTLFARCIGLGIERGCTALDLGLGMNQEKERWGGQARPVISLTLAGNHLRGAAAVTLYRAARTARDLRDRHRRSPQAESEGEQDEEG